MRPGATTVTGPAWALIALAGCAASTPLPTPEERATVEVRSTTESRERIFDAALEAAFDLGYLVTMCDRRSGIFAGTIPHVRVYPPTSDPSSDISVVVDARAGTIRVTTAEGGTPVLDAERIGAFYAALAARTRLGPAPGPVWDLRGGPP